MATLQQFLQPAVPSLGIVFIFTALPLSMVLRGMTSWVMVLVLGLMNSAAIGWFILEDRHEEHLIRQA